MTCRGLSFFLFFREVVLGEVRGDWEEGISEKVEAFLNNKHLYRCLITTHKLHAYELVRFSLLYWDLLRRTNLIHFSERNENYTFFLFFHFFTENVSCYDFNCPSGLICTLQNNGENRRCLGNTFLY